MAVNQHFDHPGDTLGRKKRGMKPGQTNRGSFKPGPDPRRCHSTDGIVEMRQQLHVLCQRETEAAVAFLKATMADESLPLRQRVVCAQELLDRGHGRSVDLSVMATVTGGDANLSKSVNLLSNDELANLVTQARELTSLGSVNGSLAAEGVNTLDAKYEAVKPR